MCDLIVVHTRLERPRGPTIFDGDPVFPDQSGVDRIIGQREIILNRCAIIGVGVPEVDIQKPVVAVGVFIEPLGGNGFDIVNDFIADFPCIIDFVESPIEPIGAVAFTKRTDQGCATTALAKQSRQAAEVVFREELTGGTLNKTIRGCTAVPGYPGVKAELTAHQRTA